MTREEVIKILEILHQRMDYPTKEALAIAICHLSQPSLPPNLDEAEEKYAYNNWEDNDYHTGASEGLPFDAIGHTKKCFRAGAEWMAGQFHFVTAHCCESANPASESVDKPLHLITLIYEDDDKNPYVAGGDNVEVCLRKK